VTAPPGDAASASVLVGVPPAEAFEVFTNEIDLWWRRGPRFRFAGKSPGVLAFVGGLGGRLVETVELASGTRSFDVGAIVGWDPPRALAVEWRGINFKPGEKTLVEISFEPRGAGTFVTVHHSGWAALPEGHPVRHGQPPAEFARTIGLWWAALLTSLRERIAGEDVPPGPP